MRFLIYTDVHFCEYSSIVRSHGNTYSRRLENLISSVNWAESQAKENNCDEIICLGDFFNKPDLNSRELTALQDISWATLPHTFLVGNHDACDRSLIYNSVSALKNNGFAIINQPTLLHKDNQSFLLLPYISEDDRKPLFEYSENADPKSLYVFSHNDIKGLQYGNFLSKEGFSTDEIESSCRLFLNGHLHNGDMFCKNGVNIGNLTGQNFSEDALKYPHCVAILDTFTNTLSFIENPYALNFYKLDYTSSNDIDYSFEIKENSVLSIRCRSDQADYIKSALLSLKNSIVDYRVSVIPELLEDEIVKQNIATYANTDHKAKFIEFCKSNLALSDILLSELQEVCK